jgi:hypothetical protein
MPYSLLSSPVETQLFLLAGLSGNFGEEKEVKKGQKGTLRADRRTASEPLFLDSGAWVMDSARRARRIATSGLY